MPRPSREPSHVELATNLLNSAAIEMGPVEAAAKRQEATVHAMLAIVSELSGIRDEIANVDGALRDVSGHGAGVALDHISDWLEKISRKS